MTRIDWDLPHFKIRYQNKYKYAQVMVIHYKDMALSRNSFSSFLCVALFPVAGDGAVSLPMYCNNLKQISKIFLKDMNNQASSIKLP